MTSAVHGGIHNVSHHAFGVGWVGIINGISEPVISQNYILIYSALDSLLAEG